MITRIFPHACLNIDCSWAQWLEGLKRSISTPSRASDLPSQISSLFSSQNNVIVTVCIRTAFDLYLSAINLPPGSEVLITSINIPEMTRILRMHGLIPVPIDINLETLITPADKIEAAITSHTRLIVVAMLYGVTFDLTEIGEIAKKKGIPIFEDCAECYSGNNFFGSECAEATVFSFGPIKTATAFGGGVIIVRNQEVFSKMNSIHSKYPVQPKKAYVVKVLRYSLGMISLNSTIANNIIRRTSHLFNIDHKKYVVKLMRGFPPSTGLEIYRFQPCNGLLSFLHWRLTNIDQEELMKSMEKLNKATQVLTDGKVFVPGHQTKRKVYWLYPVIVNNANLDHVSLNNAGIDAYRGISQLNKIDPPTGSSYPQIPETNKMFNALLYFPLHKDVPENVVIDICIKAVDTLNPGPKL